MTDPDPFDEIVRNLDLDLDFPQPAHPPAPPAQPLRPAAAEDDQDDQDDQFYRRVQPRSILPRDPRVLLAWLGVIAGPIIVMASSAVHLILPRPVLLGGGLIFVASAIYLIAQLPERGPGEPYWPDDGAQL
ncbi:MAG TPA: hypothetical protein VJL80_10780 [Aeromicrobium sp.]|nr:hypothetical protein [Aeromicrobium sp.]HKY58515.1 hypothetical protein [Aeromicrobium sp.]